MPWKHVFDPYVEQKINIVSTPIPIKSLPGVKGISFDQSYIPVAHADSFNINIYISDMCRLTARICDSMNAFQNKIFPFMNDFVSFNRPIIWSVLKIITPILLSINLMVHFFFNVWTEFKVINQQDNNVIDSLVHWLQFWNIIKLQLIMTSTLGYFLMLLCTILQFILIMSFILTTIVMIQPFLK